MGPKRRGRPRNVHTIVAEEDKDTNQPPKKKGKVKLSTVKAVTIPVSERDEEIVECDKCGQESTFREFRIHNLTSHYNLALIKDDSTVKDRRFYDRALKNMAKLMKITVFSCPNEGCDFQYRSSLGLAYHLVQCGKTVEEIKANYIQCDICGKSYSSATIAWHKRTHTAKVESEGGSSPPKRASSRKALEKFKEIAGDKADEDEVQIEVTVERDETFVAEGDDEEEEPFVRTNKDVPATAQEDISWQAYKSLSTVPWNIEDTWERPERRTTDIFTDTSINPLTPCASDEEALKFLPTRRVSLPFKTKTRIKCPGNTKRYNSTDFHRLRIFDSEIADSESGNNVINTGGPISSLSWHPSGKYLAVAVLRDINDKPRVNYIETSPTCIQIYENFYEDKVDGGQSASGLSLKLILGVSSGFIHHVQWSSFWPPEDSELIGHLAYACGDSEIGIICVQKSDLKMPPNIMCSDESPQMVPVYTKIPEVTLVLNSSSREEAGQCVTFHWHENMKFLAAGYASGLVTLFSVQSQSRLLRKSVVVDQKNSTVEMLPIWYIRAHTDVVSVVTFASIRSRYLITCSYDYWVKTWDLELRREVECKKIGMVLDACWIRGWFHLAVASEYANLNYQISNFNAIKFFPFGSSKGVVSISDHLNITSVSFFEGLIAQASELGRVTLAYYDQFLRDCDYERNKKKRNAVDFLWIEVDKSEPRTKEFVEDEERRLVLTFQDRRRDSHHVISELCLDNFEDYVVHYRLVRVNRVEWCPTGKQLATGFHNGLLVVSPTSYSGFYQRSWL